MFTDTITPAELTRSVLAVPPLARDQQGAIVAAENRKIMRHIEAGGVSTLLYGGNAVLYHIALSEYPGLLQMLVESAGKDTWVIPSVGPSFGMMMDQVAILRDFQFPTAMLLPELGPSTDRGTETAIRKCVDRLGKPIILYVKHEPYLEPQSIGRMMRDGLIAAIKYAVVRKDPAQDVLLDQIIEQTGPERIVSGIGEQPAITHMRKFGLAGFTSGCVCIAPALSQQMLHAVQGGEWERAESIRQKFAPLEGLRNGIHPIRVLHAAVRLAGIANTGPIQPLLDDVNYNEEREIAEVVRSLLSSRN